MAGYGANGQQRGWGPRLDVERLEDLYSPQEVRPFTVPDAGIDNLSLSSTDTFELEDGRELRVDFDGYFRVARGEPTSRNWSEAIVPVNLVDIRLTGKSDELGTITVRPNTDIVSAGQTFPGRGDRAAAKCRIAAGVVFEAADSGLALYNPEPILLMNDAIEAVPPLEDPNGAAHVYRLPLYQMTDGARSGAAPDAMPVAYLLSLRYTVGTYITEERAKELRQI